MKTLLWVRLSGDAPDIGLGEALALCEARAGQSRLISRLDYPPVAIMDCGMSPPDLGELGGFIKEAGELIWEGNADRLLADGIKALRTLLPAMLKFRVTGKADVEGLRDERLSYTLMSKLGEVIADLGVEIDVKKPTIIVKAFITRSRAFLVLVKPRKKAKWVERDLKRRPFKHPSMLKPKLARALVNLSRPKHNCLFLDPFSGTGGLLIEAWSVGCRPVGIEVREDIARGSTRNLSWAEAAGEIVVGDATSLPVRRADALATDMPYGRMSSIVGEGKDTYRLLVGLVDQLPSILRGYASVMVRERVREYETTHARIVDIFYFREHDALTRKILVYKVGE